MTARFAGSRSLDERRRRYLATNDRETLPPVETSPAAKDADSQSKMVDLRHFPLRKVVSPKAWKITVTGLLVALLGLSIVGLEVGDWLPAGALGPGWQRLMDGQGIRPGHLFQAALLIASGQLAFLIWWGRSQSLRDFEGQYRIWLWAALALFLTGWGLIGQWHWALSDTLCWHWSARFPQREVVCWLVPACLVAGVLWKKLSADMRECKWSYALMVLGLVLGLAACIFRLEIDRTGWPTDMKRLAGASLQMASCVGIFVSLLAHARFVIHISAEPPKRRQSLIGRGLHWIKALFRKLPKPRLNLSALWKRKTKVTSDQTAKSPKRSRKQPAAETKNSKPDQVETKPSASSAPKTTAKTPVVKVTSPPEAKPTEAKVEQKSSARAPQAEMPKNIKPAEPPPQKATPGVKPEAPPPVKAEVAPIAKTNPVVSPPKPAAVAPASKPTPEPDSIADDDLEDDGDESQYRVDQPIGADQLRGLSKKERRKLRKQHRDAQRKG